MVAQGEGREGRYLGLLCVYAWCVLEGKDAFGSREKNAYPNVAKSQGVFEAAPTSVRGCQLPSSLGWAESKGCREEDGWNSAAEFQALRKEPCVCAPCQLMGLPYFSHRAPNKKRLGSDPFH